MKPKTLANNLKNEMFFRNQIMDDMKLVTDNAFSVFRLCYDYRNAYALMSLSEKDEFLNLVSNAIKSILIKQVKDSTTLSKVDAQITGVWNPYLYERPEKNKIAS